MASSLADTSNVRSAPRFHPVSRPVGATGAHLPNGAGTPGVQPAFCAVYSAAVSSGPVDATSTFSSQPCPYGSEFTTEGSSTAPWLISTTVPDTGLYSSDTDLVDSISPTTAPATISSPT